MIVIPLTLVQANDLVDRLHRHHKPAVGHRFSIGAEKAGVLVGAAIVGRPKARMTGQYAIAEVDRLVTDGTKNACSFLYAACARIADAMGFAEIQTFILASESGVTLIAAGWERVAESAGGSWSRPSRERSDPQPTAAKVKWRKVLTNGRAR